jgi:Ankyrin repeats (3 copies)
VDVVRVLLAAGTNVHAGGRWAPSDDALVHAVIGNQVPILRLLLAAGANAHAGDGWPLRWAIEHGYEIAEVLRQAIAAADPLSAGPELRLPTYGPEDMAVLLREATEEQTMMGVSRPNAVGTRREPTPLPHL